MIKKSTLQLLRFHFSFFLLPVYFFALSQLPHINYNRAFLIFVLLHVLVYPSSNGYNSYMDRDETPIGGLEHPLQPTKQLFNLTLLMDFIALSTAIFVSVYFFLGLLLYIIASRAYSYRGIRLKKFPIVNTSVGINILSSSSEAVSLQPNPTANGEVLINVPLSALDAYQVYNSNLQLVHATCSAVSNNQSKLDIAAATAGIYFLKMRINHSIIVKKIVVSGK